MKTPALHELREDSMCLQKFKTIHNDNEDDNDDCAEAIIGHLQERIIGQRKKRPVYPLGYVNFTKFIYFYFLIKRLKLIGSWFPERFAKFYLVLSRENKGTLCSLDVSPLQYSAMLALRQSRVYVMTFQAIDLNVRTPQNERLHTVSRPTPEDSLSVRLFSLAISS